MMSSSRVAATDATGATFSTPENAGGAAPAVTLGSYDAEAAQRRSSTRSWAVGLQRVRDDKRRRGRRRDRIDARLAERDDERRSG